MPSYPVGKVIVRFSVFHGFNFIVALTPGAVKGINPGGFLQWKSRRGFSLALEPVCLLICLLSLYQ
jgi:hypothetical protein